jgi:hypothetical protein
MKIIFFLFLKIIFNVKYKNNKKIILNKKIKNFKNIMSKSFPKKLSLEA